MNQKDNNEFPKSVSLRHNFFNDGVMGKFAPRQEFLDSLSPEQREKYDKITKANDYEFYWLHHGFQNWLRRNYPRAWSVAQDEAFQKEWRERDYESWQKAHDKERYSVKAFLRNLLT